MKWNVVFSRQARKSIRSNKTPQEIKDLAEALADELEDLGPTRNHWANYGKFKGLPRGVDKRHCLLRKGNPTWVCCWQVEKKRITIEVYYVGTHENAPYSKERDH